MKQHCSHWSGEASLSPSQTQSPKPRLWTHYSRLGFFNNDLEFQSPENVCGVPSQSPLWGGLGISSLAYKSDSPDKTKRLWPVGSQFHVRKWFQRIWCERTKIPRLSSVFIMLLLTLFSFYLQVIIYPQSIILVLVASPLLPTSTKSYTMLCCHHNYYIITFAL